jgi:dihydroflavonol-4-reductase
MSSSASVLLTGVTGFIGAHLAVQPLHRGYTVRGSLRDLRRAEAIRAVIGRQAPTERLSFVRGELTEADCWLPAAEGMDYVLHVASPIMTSLPRHEDELIIPAREGTRNVLTAARRAGVKRVVMTSSIAAVGYGHDHHRRQVLDEHIWTDPTDRRDTTPYSRSKTYAEQLAWEFAGEHELELVTILPSVVFGPVLEKDYGVSAEIIRQLLQGDIPGLARLNFPIVDVRDVADLHLRALSSPRAAGQRYLATADNRHLAEVVAFLRQEFPAFRSRLPRWKLPDWLVQLYALFDPEIRSVSKDLGTARIYSSAKARAELDWQARPPEAAIRATAESLLDFGIVSPP